MDTSIEAYCLIGSLCSFMVIQPSTLVQGSMESQGLGPAQQHTPPGLLLADETAKARKCYDHVGRPTQEAIATSFFLSASYFGLEKHNAAWYHLQEAITLAQLLGMHDESTYIAQDAASDVRRRMFWLLFITER